MAALPPFLLVLDISALMSGSRREWQEFSRIGSCFVPEAVLEEMRFLCDRASDAAHEQTAREFFRFFPESGWRTTALVETHPLLQPAEGHALSKKARLALTVAQAAYGLALHRADGLTILVANDLGLMQRLRSLEVHNLCAIPLMALVQWSRTERKPPVVAHQLQAMRSPVGATASAPAKKSVRAVSPMQSTPTASRPSTRRPSPRKPFRIPITKIFFNLLTLATVGVMGLAIWRVVHPPSFAQFWQQLPLQNLLSPSKPAPTGK
ncbi:hypothetical protein J5X98_18765 [Leptothermofonsia sichuanensis E412]|uniref:PIN domain-containing protein n=1 Tax=Leptothermofonsia sichuanensis TaxID=2917832 RepID=UPI001CA6DC58|nr:PIN domain-containing protein [Leptothermofonsia sichuanensis]QZZ19406.1 hypothetical protein J5X98_18765 [Leptothermofonsia sichuanensis E412]